MTENASDLYSEMVGLFRGCPVSRALDGMYDRIDDLMLQGRFEPVERMLRLAAEDSRPLPLVALGGLLTITLPWRDRLGEARTVLAARALEVAQNEHGDQEARAILKGLL
jgi:hypothetical protein